MKFGFSFEEDFHICLAFLTLQLQFCGINDTKSKTIRTNLFITYAHISVFFFNLSEKLLTRTIFM